ncbi:hypothetical protein [Undibacterium sp. TS12]|uniref:hypothetical protein n=1 Tax=Undibacterium sp. TS12 TaxID=2908202 RepID=UPI001F4C958E|nr:hypothetical protein [Undibacterium sp. TS12]MCH8622942.1 hypothetical protein [Undibacterium sp. TS12]
MFIFPTHSLTAKVEAHIHEQVRAEAPFLYWGFVIADFVARAGKYIAIVSMFFGAVLLHLLKEYFPEGSPQYKEVLNLTTHAFVWFSVASVLAYLCRMKWWTQLQTYVERATKTFSLLP